LCKKFCESIPRGGLGICGLAICGVQIILERYSSGSILPTFEFQAKIRWRKALGKNFDIQFHHQNLSQSCVLKFAIFCLAVLPIFAQKKASHPVLEKMPQNMYEMDPRKTGQE